MRTEDGYIIHRCLDGDSAAFGFLVDKYREGVYAFAYSRLHNFHDAEDIAQEVFIKAYKNLRTLRRYDNVLAWLYSITSNLCKNYVRDQSKRPDHQFTEDKSHKIIDINSMRSYREKQADESLRESLQEALNILPEAHRQVLTLHYLVGMDSKEIARFLGTSQMNILQKLKRARSELKKEILDMMNMTFEEHKLPLGFTLHVMEIVKRINIQPFPRIDMLPWGLSIAAGIILAILGMNVNTDQINPIDTLTSSAIFSPVEVSDTREIPVEVLKIPQISGNSGNSYEGENKPDGGKGFSLLAPAGQGFDIPEKPSAHIGKGDIVQLAFSPDGKILAAASMIGIYLYDAENLKEIGFLKGHTIRLANIAFTPDGETLFSLGWDGTARLWDVKQQKELGILNIGLEPDHFAVSPDGKLLAVGAFETIQIWDIEKKKMIDTLRGQPNYASSLAFSHDGKILASGDSNNKIRLWDMKEQKQIGILEGHQEFISSLIFTPDGKQLISGSWDQTVRFWDVNEKKQINILQGFWPYMALKGDGKILVLNDWNDNILHFWDMQDWRESDTLRVQEPVIRFAFSHDGKTIATYGADTTLLLWDVLEKNEMASLQAHNSRVTGVCFSSDSKTMAICYSGSGIVRLWDTQEQKELKVFETIKKYIQDIDFSPDDSLLAGVTYSSEVALWDIKEQKYLGIIFQSDKEYFRIAFNPDGKTVALGCEDGVIQFLDIQKREITGELDGHSGRVYYLDFNSDGSKLASLGAEGGNDGSLCIWDVQDKKRLEKFQKQGMFPMGYSFNKDLIVMLSYQVDMSLKVWDVKKNIQIASLQANPAMWEAEFSPDPNIIATGGARVTPVCLWNIEEKKLLATLPGHTEQIL